MVSHSQQKRQRSKKLLQIVFLIIGLLGILSIITGIYLDSRTKVLSFTEDIPVVTDKNITAPIPTNIKIKSAGIDLPIIRSNIEKGIWEISDNSASYLGTSARPGEGGNIVIYGHNKKDLFGNLKDSIKIGDDVEILTKDNKYIYNISEILTVNPDNISVVLPTKYEVLTLFTCSGILDSKRLVVKARPLRLNF